MTLSSAVAPWRSRLLAVAERRLPALTRLKQPEALPIRLHRHRIYVLPTRFGLMFSVVLFVMLMGALNYNNNPALLLTCLLGAACYQSVFQAFRCINGMQLVSMRGRPCHAGEPLHIDLSLRADGRPRRSLRLRVVDQETVFDIDGGEGQVPISAPTALRGWYRVGRIRLYSEFPFGLFRVWSWLNPDFAALIYPRIEIGAPPLPHADDAAAEAATKRSGDEFSMLRDYHPSDPRRSIAWKASARHDTLLVKEFEQRRGQDVALEWSATAALVHEARISRLAAWVHAADRAQLRYVLRLPDQTVGPGLGPDHRHACLRALALQPGAAT